MPKLHSLVCIVILLVIHSMCHADGQSNSISVSINDVTFTDVHVWPDSRCEICHISSVPDQESAALITADISLLCESCHTGRLSVISSHSTGNNGSRPGNHPVKFTPLDFDPDKINHTIVTDGNSFFIDGQGGRVRLFGSTRESAIVECSSCHDPHGRSEMPFLQRENIPEEDFCTICHLSIKK